jgi:hypothetical protein
LNWSSRIAEAFQVIFDAISVDSALTGMGIGVVAGPKEFGISIFIVPPRKRDVVKLKRGVVTFVLNYRNKPKTNLNELNIVCV